jgi:hypothetical protein
LRVAVDPRIELVSIVCYLAGAPEYQFQANTPYRRLVRDYFEAARAHPAVETAARLRRDHGISHDAPLGLAVYLDPVRLEPMVQIDQVELDPRWRGLDVVGFAEQLRDFGQEHRVRTLLLAQAAYISSVEDRVAASLHGAELRRWFINFLGPTHAQFVVVPKLLASAWSYDVHAHLPSGRDSVYIILELEDIDDAGLPRPANMTMTLVVHEMCHAYVNPAADREYAAIAEPSERLFQLVLPQMMNLAYSSPLHMIRESLVRALVVLYLHTKVSEELAHQTVEAEVRRGFLWMPRLVDALVPIAARVGRTQIPADVGEMVRALGPLFTAEAEMLERARAEEEA